MNAPLAPIFVLRPETETTKKEQAIWPHSSMQVSILLITNFGLRT